MFEIGRDGSDIIVRIDRDVVALLRRLNGEYRHLLEKAPEDDPAYDRLFPRAYEDAAHEEQYVELVRTDLERAKDRVAEDMADYLGGSGSLELHLCPDHIHTWLTWLTDVRLAIGTRIGVTEEMLEQDPDPEDPQAASLAILDLLAWLQESLLDALQS